MSCEYDDEWMRISEREKDVRTRRITKMQQISKSGSCAAWAPDSKRLVYGHDGDGGIWIADVDGKGRTQLVSEGKDPSWSPDGRMIAYISQKEDE